jgi:hypothetical protein
MYVYVKNPEGSGFLLLNAALYGLREGIGMTGSTDTV